MTLLQMTYIMEIYKFGSMNKAANSLYVSQSAISNAIREVEDELGVCIFKRSNKGVSLTDDGKELVAQIGPIVEQNAKIEKYYKNRLTLNEKRFAVSSQRYPFCSKAFVEFIKKNPTDAYAYKFNECEMNAVVEDVSSRNSDIGILFLSDMTEKFLRKIFSGRGLEFTEIKKVRTRVFLSANHPLAGRKEINPEELTAYPQVVFDRKYGSNYNFSEEPPGVREKYAFKRVIGVRDRATAYNIMANTDAFSIGSGLLPQGYCDPEIKAVPLEGQLERMCIGYIKIKDLPLSEDAKQYLEILSEVLEYVED